MKTQKNSKKLWFIVTILIVGLSTRIFATTIWEAAQNGNVTELKRFIEKIGVDINKTRKIPSSESILGAGFVAHREALTPLMLAIYENKEKAVKYLCNLSFQDAVQTAKWQNCFFIK